MVDLFDRFFSLSMIIATFRVVSRRSREGLAESDLRRVDVSSLPDNYFGESTRILAADQLALNNDSGSSNEIWPQILLLLAGVLALEQFLGWWFGRRR